MAKLMGVFLQFFFATREKNEDNVDDGNYTNNEKQHSLNSPPSTNRIMKNKKEERRYI
jgi:hypothetical protein